VEVIDKVLKLVVTVFIPIVYEFITFIAIKAINLFRDISLEMINIIENDS
jgi:hypothetical protein